MSENYEHYRQAVYYTRFPCRQCRTALTNYEEETGDTCYACQTENTQKERERIQQNLLKKIHQEVQERIEQEALMIFQEGNPIIGYHWKSFPQFTYNASPFKKPCI